MSFNKNNNLYFFAQVVTGYSRFLAAPQDIVQQAITYADATYGQDPDSSIFDPNHPELSCDDQSYTSSVGYSVNMDPIPADQSGGRSDVVEAVPSSSSASSAIDQRGEYGAVEDIPRQAQMTSSMTSRVDLRVKRARIDGASYYSPLSSANSSRQSSSSSPLMQGFELQHSSSSQISTSQLITSALGLKEQDPGSLNFLTKVMGSAKEYILYNQENLRVQATLLSQVESLRCECLKVQSEFNTVKAERDALIAEKTQVSDYSEVCAQLQAEKTKSERLQSELDAALGCLIKKKNQFYAYASKGLEARKAPQGEYQELLRIAHSDE